jgi:type II secretory pathway component PulF
VILHALLGVVFLVVMLLVVPGYKRDFAEHEIALPWVTTKVIGVSDWLAAYWYVVIIFALPLLALDGGIVFLCWPRRGTRILGILWVILLIVLWLLVMAFVASSLLLADLKFQQALGR